MTLNITNYFYRCFKQDSTICDPIEESIGLSLLEKSKWVFLQIFGSSHTQNIPRKSLYKHLKIQKLVNSLLKECNINKKVVVKLDYRSSAPASASPYQKIIWINPLFYVDWNALPERLKVSGMDDPKLQNRDFYKDFFEFIFKTFKQGPGKNINCLDIFCLLLFIQLRNDPQNLYSAIRTMLAHELGHIQDENTSFYERLYNKTILFKIRWKKVTRLIGPILNQALNIFAILDTRTKETTADRFAAEKLKDATVGAEYGFSGAKKAMKALKACHALSWSEHIKIRCLIPLNEGPIPMLLTHGSYSGRTKFIRAINQQTHK